MNLTLNDNQEKTCQTTYWLMNTVKHGWRDPIKAPKQRNLWRLFYNGISSVPSGYVSTKIIEIDSKKRKLGGDRIVQEHWSTPEMVGKFIFDNADVYLNDYEKFRQLYIACSTTIKTLHSENQTLRQQKDVPVLDKYNKAGIDLFGESRVVWHYEPFPLSHLLPQEVIDYDRRLINEQSA